MNRMNRRRQLQPLRAGDIDALHEWDANVTVAHCLLAQHPKVILEVGCVITEVCAGYCSITFRRGRRDIVLESPDNERSREIARSRLAGGYYVFFSSMITDKEMLEVFQ
ncbi:hypothetical protein [Burkholderia stagnalis]|uniref:hypothetical protein n=1 Tax=Burkholderia stagnalis TaxID=1503054 RepID=UPI00163B5316|nr:hypothetical protein [Burkholderia stagnalis]